MEGLQASPCTPQRGTGGVRDHGVVFQPAEPRCLSDELSAVNIERRCGEEQAGRLGGCSGRKAGGGWGNRGVGDIPGHCKEQLAGMKLLPVAVQQ